MKIDTFDADVEQDTATVIEDAGVLFKKLNAFVDQHVLNHDGEMDSLRVMAFGTALVMTLNRVGTYLASQFECPKRREEATVHFTSAITELARVVDGSTGRSDGGAN